MTKASKADLPQGTLDLLILKVVAAGPFHEYAIARTIQQISQVTRELTSRDIQEYEPKFNEACAALASIRVAQKDVESKLGERGL